ncbi:MgtC/SapB family protein [Bacillus bombysepticus]|uniref:MgtC/SapB family protein n=1 Tax=Bacillus bombysepticus TaxID=658666 RepID=UPI003016E7BB
MYEITIKLLIAMALGFIVGLEREIKHKPVGFKTLATMSATCCLITVVSIQGARDLSSAYVTPMDPFRLTAQVISGVGFIGGGVILRRQNVDAISGLTTAAVIWASAGAGIAVGAGYIKEACITTALILIGLNLIPLLMNLIGPRRLKEKEWDVELYLQPDTNVTDIFKLLKEQDIRIRREEIKDVKVNNKSFVLLKLRVLAHRKTYTSELYDTFKTWNATNDVKIQTV